MWNARAAGRSKRARSRSLRYGNFSEIATTQVRKWLFVVDSTRGVLVYYYCFVLLV